MTEVSSSEASALGAASPQSSEERSDASIRCHPSETELITFSSISDTALIRATHNLKLTSTDDISLTLSPDITTIDRSTPRGWSYFLANIDPLHLRSFQAHRSLTHSFPVVKWLKQASNLVNLSLCSCWLPHLPVILQDKPLINSIVICSCLSSCSNHPSISENDLGQVERNWDALFVGEIVNSQTDDQVSIESLRLILPVLLPIIDCLSLLEVCEIPGIIFKPKKKAFALHSTTRRITL